MWTSLRLNLISSTARGTAERPGATTLKSNGVGGAGCGRGRSCPGWTAPGRVGGGAASAGPAIPNEKSKPKQALKRPCGIPNCNPTLKALTPQGTYSGFIYKC